MGLTDNIQYSISNWLQEKGTHTVSKLSSLTGVSRATIKNINMGRNIPRIQTAYKILEVTEGRERALTLITKNFVVSFTIE